MVNSKGKTHKFQIPQGFCDKETLEEIKKESAKEALGVCIRKIKFSADIRIMCDLFESSEVSNYMKDHGWEMKSGGCGGTRYYKNHDYFSDHTFTKKFDSIEQMQKDIAKVEKKCNKIGAKMQEANEELDR